jgi:hypothetical protein
MQLPITDAHHAYEGFKGSHRVVCGVHHAIYAQDFTLKWAIPERMMIIRAADYAAAAATLRGMAGRLTALVVPCTRAALLAQAALVETAPQLAGALSYLSFKFSISNTEQLCAATHAILPLSAGLRQLDLGLGELGQIKDYSTVEVHAADAAFQHLMRSLPCCQSLRLAACGAVSHQAMGRELLCAAPDLVSLELCTGHFNEQVSTSAAQRSIICIIQMLLITLLGSQAHTAPRVLVSGCISTDSYIEPGFVLAV